MSDDQITDQITDLARLLPAGPTPDLPADRLQILKEHLMVEYRLAADNRRPTPQRRRARRPLRAALGAGPVDSRTTNSGSITISCSAGAVSPGAASR